jgi:hypothetical protein
MEAKISDCGVRRKLCVSAFSRVSLCLAIGGFVVAVVANLGLYINGDFLPDEVRGPHPLAGAVGEVALQVGIFVIPCVMILSFFGLPLSFFRGPVVVNFLAALSALLVSTVAWHINTDGLMRVRANPARFHAREVTRLAIVIGTYTKEHDGYLPIPGDWCKTLTEFDPNTAGYLSYPMVKSTPPGFSTVALNASLEGRRLADVRGGVVLLFGTRPAENPVGDHQLLTADNYNGIGAVVLFTDLHLEFVKVDNFGGLRWEP